MLKNIHSKLKYQEQVSKRHNSSDIPYSYISNICKIPKNQAPELQNAIIAKRPQNYPKIPFPKCRQTRNILIGRSTERTYRDIVGLSLAGTFGRAS